jgi:hypothetical protein
MCMANGNQPSVMDLLADDAQGTDDTFPCGKIASVSSSNVNLCSKVAACASASAIDKPHPFTDFGRVATLRNSIRT